MTNPAASPASVPVSDGSESAPVVGLSADTVVVDEPLYEALLRLAAAHKRAICTCENCTPNAAFAYDNCECGEDWSSCSDDVAVLDAYVPNWRGQQW